MTTTARLLTILALSLPLAACAAQPAPRIAAPMDQAAATGQDGKAGSAAAPSATPATQAAAPAPAAGQHAADNAPAQAPSTTSAPQPRRSAGTATATAGAVAAAAAAPAQAPSAPAAEAAAVPAAAANAPALNPASPAAPETTVGGGAANRPAPAAGAGTVTMPASSATGSLLQTLLALIVVLGVLGALAWFLKRYGPKAGGGNANLRVVGALNLGGRERVLVVEVGDQWIVVGASPGRINALATMPKQENADMTSAGATLAPHSQPANNFADWLKQTIDKRK
jgi:flagellar biosynthetic protein FliO